jgi:hypothetical protein
MDAHWIKSLPINISLLTELFTVFFQKTKLLQKFEFMNGSIPEWV